MEQIYVSINTYINEIKQIKIVFCRIELMNYISLFYVFSQKSVVNSAIGDLVELYEYVVL